MSGLVLMKSRLKSTRRVNFSLLEIIVALVILVMAMAFVGIKGVGLIQTYRFENAMESIKREVGLTHQVATSYQIDIDFKLEQTAKGVAVTRVTDERLRHLVPFFKDQLFFKGLKFSDEGVNNHTIHFYGSGWVEPRKGFYLGSKQNVAFIDISQALSPLVTSE